MTDQPTLVGMERGGAELSPDGLYRYRLWRALGAGTRGTVLFVMCNPSTADADRDDATLRRCMGYGRLWGFDRLEVVNLFAYRSRDPDALVAARDPEGPDNPRAVNLAVRHAELVVAAWGEVAGRVIRRRGPGPRDPRSLVAATCAAAGRPLQALELSAEGHPRHPLYLPETAEPTPWRWQPDG